MTVYAIAQLRFRDRGRYERYLQRFMDVLRKFPSGRALAADDAPVQLEGRWEYDKLVLLSFADAASFQAWYTSPDYQEIVADRHAGTEGVVILVRGIE